MTPFKSATLFFTGSLAVHAVLAASFYWPSFSPKDLRQEAVTISYVRTSPEPAARKEEKITRLSARKPTPFSAERAPSKDPAAVMQSSELLTDPEKGDIFFDYFSKVKEKINVTIQKRSSHKNTRQGNVALVFILNADGRLETALVSEKESQANDAAKNFAVNSVKEAAPFTPFPKELGLGKIAFSITLLFGES